MDWYHCWTVKMAARREPIVLGKPNKHMFKILEETFKLDPERTVMVGDRIDTDIQMAHNCGLKSLLVLTGVSDLEDVKAAAQSPDPSRKACVPTSTSRNSLICSHC
ncbi:glycerol-3-phosphate phosphatase-like [Liolophura sinensis]|uniref:glycerol-3-phosphate phosphatase-like n=1 Tax=Liolophura sinensis TaxID=3198878 RepID=UPI0031589F19